MSIEKRKKATKKKATKKYKKLSVSCRRRLGCTPVCTDVNECTEGGRQHHRCQHTCLNTLGNYSCSCNPGYYLHDDGLSCAGRRSHLTADCWQRSIHTSSLVHYELVIKMCQMAVIYVVQLKSGFFNFTFLFFSCRYRATLKNSVLYFNWILCINIFKKMSMCELIVMMCTVSAVCQCSVIDILRL